MTQIAERPRFLNLMKIRLPLPGVLSILHRISGVLMVLAIPFLIYLLDFSLRDAAGFAAAAGVLDMLLIKLGLAVIVWGLFHHLFAGIRYLLLDMDIGVEKQQARASSWIVFGVSIVVTLIVLGVIW
ncbi:succinate dehydrogenase, cytochrome b556 subunit [Solemya velum gill symbiont]|uniref:succinate dehydrogenase, cytochrome b556 subunit n=1 Tax=Solemya velum gill symbiont TaxID=2340 RepID=UPI0009967077|nr:succinate dehydrogenase, cytochrome b556 subunit [Solemya velum gill symbiont]OOY99734.1 succinate dehydrogenase, cytochrome b556 subunit [Solemya velum gill symbiont]OOZ01919.1 succinate dehydrogenase, cytochrome b556 subunit [Solemya velum gill symbiont]OOZ04356.1 succinate dehydrogenase, cytochrome b556 subunit [Solemya velum gill symbiont]OOZ06499.1 succinate dehydrogenase, cytochrome b556 subunit [Solemya velum gill symbiont]OOZ08685.1 succinate dehydrogenase, cytochrome b556 subunit [